MKEKIGLVTLDDTYYPGQDLYSDGEIEDKLLEIARTYPEEQWNRVIAEKKSWPILYHYSHIRENVLSWLPFDGTENVLEIGSGCGAVTGALCKKAEKVTCIELSKKRSLINAYRHQNYANLTILMGNFQDIEPTLKEQYDYITLIGVFEYGEAYINSKTPYRDFLRIIARHLKPDGKIVLAIENRFGLKYFAGCTEDHFGTLFEGIEGYPSTKGVKTFTKKELTGILKEAGDLKASWYYPYPDYKLPMAIYSDRRLPQKGELNRFEMNYDRLRLQLFAESSVYDSLIDNDLFPEFSNSFLLLIGTEEPHNNIAFSKFSNERDQKFALRTDIIETEHKEKYVLKTATSNAGNAHIENLAKLYEKLTEQYKGTDLSVNTCVMGSTGAQFEFLEGETLEESLDKLLEEGEAEKAEELLLEYVKRIRSIHSKEVFSVTPEFTEVFGDVSFEGEQTCAAVSDIDLVPANILLEYDSVSVIDYEWTFAFPVPCDFIVYRLLHYYLESDAKRNVLPKEELYAKAGLTEEEIKTFEVMEQNFQKYMLGGHTPLLAMYKDVSPGKVDARIYYDQQLLKRADRRIRVYYDYGKDFNGEDFTDYPFEEDTEEIRAVIRIPSGVKRLRIDPGEEACALSLCSLDDSEGNRFSFITNGLDLKPDCYLYDQGDPWFLIEIPDDSAKEVHFSARFLDMLHLSRTAQEEHAQTIARQEGQIAGLTENVHSKDALIEQMQAQAVELNAQNAQLNAQNAQLNAEVARLKEQISQMENTKVWKMYRAIKKE